jgi:tetratricopeptide (TPR) repeat protein
LFWQLFWHRFSHQCARHGRQYSASAPGSKGFVANRSRLRRHFSNLLTICRETCPIMSINEQSPTQAPASAPPSKADPDALWQQANDLVAQGNLLDAVPIYLQVSDLWPDQPTVWLNLGIVLGGLDRHEEARKCLQRAQDLDQDNPHILFQLGQIYQQLGQPEAAALSFLAVTELDPGFLDAWLSLADLSLQCGENDVAQQYLDEVFLIDLEHPAGNFLMGNLLLRQGDNDGAAECFAIAYKATDDPACGNNLATVLGQLDRAPEAIDLLDNLLQARPDYKLAWNTLGGLLMGCQQYARAQEALTQALRLDEGFHAARHGLARCLVQMRDLDGAQAQMQRLLQESPDDVSVMKDFAVALEWLGEGEHALAMRERALKVTPDDARLAADHAYLLRSLRRYEEAEALARRALALDKNELRAHMTIIFICGISGRMEEANAHLSQVLASGTQDVLVLNTIGTQLERWKEAGRAIAVYENILRIDPGNTHAEIRIFDLKMGMCDWSNYDENCQSQIDKMQAGCTDDAEERNQFDVFNLQALPVSYDFIGKIASHAAKQIAADARLNLDAPPLVHATPRGGRIRLGYALGYTWFHSLPLVMKEVIERHDRDRFELFGYPPPRPAIWHLASSLFRPPSRKASRP